MFHGKCVQRNSVYVRHQEVEIKCITNLFGDVFGLSRTGVCVYLCACVSVCVCVYGVCMCVCV